VVEPGEIVTVPEWAYKYGTGSLTLRVTRVRRDLLDFYGGEWVWLQGHERLWDGSEAGEERSFLVKVAALPGGMV
jgi:hypothetical protein